MSELPDLVALERVVGTLLGYLAAACVCATAAAALLALTWVSVKGIFRWARARSRTVTLSLQRDAKGRYASAKTIPTRR